MKGSIKLNKQVINEAPPALAPPSTGFQVQLTCTPNGPNTLVLLNAANNLRETITSILPESVCTISEVPPNVPVELLRRGCRWETSYPDGQSATIEAAVTKELRVVNRWTCTPPGSGGGGGGSGSNNDNKKRISVTPVNDPPVMRADEKREKAKEEKSWIPNIGISVGGSGGGGSKKD